MHSPPCTTVAGRHAEQLRRERARLADRLRVSLQQCARETLAAALRHVGLPIEPHFDPELSDERSLWVSCRIASARADHELIYAVLDTQGWVPDRTRLSRVSARYDIARVTHQKSGAKLALIIKIPFGSPAEWEAA